LRWVIKRYASLDTGVISFFTVRPEILFQGCGLITITLPSSSKEEGDILLRGVLRPLFNVPVTARVGMVY